MTCEIYDSVVGRTLHMTSLLTGTVSVCSPHSGLAASKPKCCIFFLQSKKKKKKKKRLPLIIMKVLNITMIIGQASQRSIRTWELCSVSIICFFFSPQSEIFPSFRLHSCCFSLSEKALVLGNCSLTNQTRWASDAYHIMSAPEEACQSASDPICYTAYQINMNPTTHIQL